MKRAFLVYGPESAGNRLMTRILVACGCYGDGEHHQRLNFDPPPSNATDIAWFRSVPYAQRWPDLIEHIDQVMRYDYVPYALVMNRDTNAVAQSQIKVGHSKDLTAAYRSIEAAYKVIFHAINHHNIHYVMVSYESLFLRQSAYLGWLLDHIGLRLQVPVERVIDANEKYYANP